MSSNLLRTAILATERMLPNSFFRYQNNFAKPLVEIYESSEPGRSGVRLGAFVGNIANEFAGKNEAIHSNLLSLQAHVIYVQCPPSQSIEVIDLAASPENKDGKNEGGGGLTCAVCTYENEIGAIICDLCESRLSLPLGSNSSQRPSKMLVSPWS